MPAIPSALPKDLFLLDPAVAFLNHGSFGATPKPVFEKYQWWQRELERQPVEFLSNQRRFTGLMRAARTALTGSVHCGADDLVYVPNATTAMNIVARSLHLQPGDEILASDLFLRSGASDDGTFRSTHSFPTNRLTMPGAPPM